jgi:hypothetical protein
MYTLMAVIALTTSYSTANLSSNPAWLTDYGAARERVTAVGKPMAVFVASGQEGWTKVVRDGGLSPEARKLLTEKFVCLYVNTDTTAGRTLAGALGDVAGVQPVRRSDRNGAATDAREVRRPRRQLDRDGGPGNPRDRPPGRELPGPAGLLRPPTVCPATVRPAVRPAVSLSGDVHDGQHLSGPDLPVVYRLR